jgi:hypothetical protein
MMFCTDLILKIFIAQSQITISLKKLTAWVAREVIPLQPTQRFKFLNYVSCKQALFLNGIGQYISFFVNYTFIILYLRTKEFSLCCTLHCTAEDERRHLVINVMYEANGGKSEKLQ